jgi:hypothetical protein
LRWSSAVLAGGFLLVTLPGLCAGQSARELQAQVLGTFADRDFLGAGLGGALRSAGRARVALTLHAGDLEGAFAGRGELVASYHLNPFRQRGVTPYVGGGVTVGVADDDVFEYVVLLIGVETTPGRRTGWYAEVGLAGGVRIAAGFRVRWR